MNMGVNQGIGIADGACQHGAGAGMGKGAVPAGALFASLLGSSLAKGSGTALQTIARNASPEELGADMVSGIATASGEGQEEQDPQGALPGASDESRESFAGILPENGIGALQAILTGFAAENAEAGLKKSVSAGMADGSPGKVRLIEKLEASAAGAVYDPEAWLEKPVQDIMKEIKDNRTAARIDHSDVGKQPVEPAAAGVAMDDLKQQGMRETAAGRSVVQEMPAIITNGAAPSGSEDPARTAGHTVTESGQSMAAGHLAAGMGNAAETPAIDGTVRGNEAQPAYSQLNAEILTRLEQKGPMEFTLRLNPGSLGEIDVQLKVADGKLIIDIMAASAKTQSLLISQADQLIANLGFQNVQVESVHVGSQQQAAGTLSEQMLAMSGGMDLSHRNSQERQTGKKTETSRSPIAGGQIATVESKGTAGAIRGLARKMDYAI